MVCDWYVYRGIDYCCYFTFYKKNTDKIGGRFRSWLTVILLYAIPHIITGVAIYNKKVKFELFQFYFFMFDNDILFKAYCKKINVIASYRFKKLNWFPSWFLSWWFVILSAISWSLSLISGIKLGILWNGYTLKTKRKKLIVDFNQDRDLIY